MHLVHGVERVDLAGHAPEEVAVADLADEPGLPDQLVVCGYHVVDEAGLGAILRPSTPPDPPRVRLAVVIDHEGGPAASADGDPYVDSVARKPARQLAVGSVSEPVGDLGDVRLAEPDIASEPDAVPYALGHREQLCHPVRKRGATAPVLPGHKADTCEGENL